MAKKEEKTEYKEGSKEARLAEIQEQIDKLCEERAKLMREANE